MGCRCDEGRAGMVSGILCGSFFFSSFVSLLMVIFSTFSPFSNTAFSPEVAHVLIAR